MSNNKLKQIGQKESFHTTLENLLEGCQIIDFEYRYLFINNAAAKQGHKTSEELLGHKMMEMYQGIEITLMFSVLRQCMQERIPRQMENEFIFEDGTKGCYLLSFEPVPEGVFIMSTNITKRNQAEEALKESEERFRSIYENSTVGIYRTTPDGQILLANPNLIKLLGYSSFKELADRNLEEDGFEPFYERTHFMDIMKREGEVKGLESAWTRMDGTTIFISESARAINDKEGKIIYYDGIIEDITLRKKAEQELIIANKSLTFQNEEKEKRANELIIANKELVFQNKEKERRATELTIAKERAEESDRLKSAFLTNMSHEIRTPMNGILGFTELLKEPNLSSDDQQDYIQTIQISGARMLNTINSIVDMSKIESGLMKVDIKETNINEKIEFTYKFFKPEVEIKGLQFLVKNSLPSKEVIIKTDNEKVYGILTNLIKNAIKFTFEGSIEFGYEKKGEYLEFFVKDTGIGIPQKQYQLIFERFRQGSESHNRGYEGSGLGLSIAKTYVEMLGGEIWVESEEGKGSTFYFTIPYNSISEEKIKIINAVSACLLYTS